MFYTRTGDAGTSGLFGTAERFQKDHPVYRALGTLDELNSLLGTCRAKSAAEGFAAAEKEIEKAQESLFIIQAELAGAGKTILQERIDGVEDVIRTIGALIENPHGFVLPGATELSGFLDYARAVSRRAERTVVEAARERSVSPGSRAYLNRLSSLLYVLARYAAKSADARERAPAY